MPCSLNIRCSTAALLLAVLAPLASGQGLGFTQTQVDAGKALYKETCQICHGSSLANGQFGTPLKGSFFTDKWKSKSLGELLSFVYEKMPPDKPMSLTADEYTGAVAYILSRNDIAAAQTAMSTDTEALKNVKLPW